MPIPTKADHALAAIDNSASAILNVLRIMERAAVADLPRYRVRLRDLLADYCDLVMTAARQ